MDLLKMVSNQLEREKKSIAVFAGDMKVSKQYMAEVMRGAKPASGLLKARIVEYLNLDITVNVLLALMSPDVEWLAEELVIKQIIKSAIFVDDGTINSLEDLETKDLVLRYDNKA